MLVPNAKHAVMPAAKLGDYLLSAAHPRGRGKARFFQSFGFMPSAPEILERALRKHSLDHDIARIHQSAHGVKYESEGPLPSPDGRAPVVRSVWIIDAGEIRPRFITAIPGPRR